MFHFVLELSKLIKKYFIQIPGTCNLKRYTKPYLIETNIICLKNVKQNTKSGCRSYMSTKYKAKVLISHDVYLISGSAVKEGM